MCFRTILVIKIEIQYYKIPRFGCFWNSYEIEAVKELKNFDMINKERFEREIKIISELNHPNIVNIIQWNIGGEPPNFMPYYIMEYLVGSSQGSTWMKGFVMMKGMFLKGNGSSIESFLQHVML